MRILIVEDEIHLASALRELLQKQRYAVDCVHDGEDGLDYALSGVYDAIILDIMLPKLDGIEVLRNIRSENLSTPVLLLTARDEISDKVRGLDYGADDYLTKPFSTEELLARVRAISRRKGEVSDDSLLFGDICLSRKTKELRRGAQVVALGPKEYQIMEMLLLNSHQIITKEQIIEKVWGFDGEAEHNNVEVYISFLRKKLSFLGARASVRTIRGAGYILGDGCESAGAVQ